MELTFNQIRSKVNQLLNSVPTAIPYKKTQNREYKWLFRYVVRQLGSDLSKSDIPTLKNDEYRRVFVDWLNTDGSKGCFEKITHDMVVERMTRKQNEFFAKRNFTTVLHHEHALVIGNLPSKKFYQSSEWKALRYAAIKEYGRTCSCCGAEYEKSKRIHVDHIKPRSIFPEFALSMHNVQVLCSDCNEGKSNFTSDDWRGK